MMKWGVALALLSSAAWAQEPPPGAAAIGFTALALNSDFTKPLPDGWLGGCPAGRPWGSPTDLSDNVGHTWSNNLWWHDQYRDARTMSPCTAGQTSDVLAITADNPNGTILGIPWLVTGKYYQDNVGHQLMTASWDYDGAGRGSVGFSMSNNFYAEIIARIYPSSDGVKLTFNTWPTYGIYSSSGGTEYDIVEGSPDDPPAPYSTLHNFGRDCGGYPCGNWIWRNHVDFDANSYALLGSYHKYAMRVVSNGIDLSACGYIDDQQINCLADTLSPEEVEQRLFLIMNIQCDVWRYPVLPDGDSCPRSGHWEYLAVQSVRVWESPQDLRKN